MPKKKKKSLALTRSYYKTEKPINERTQRILDLAEEGLTAPEIADIVEASPQLVRSLAAYHEVPVRKGRPGRKGEKTGTTLFILELHKRDLTPSEIAEVLGVSRQHASAIIRYHTRKKRKRKKK